MKIIKKAVSPDEGDAAFFLFWVGGDLVLCKLIYGIFLVTFCI